MPAELLRHSKRTPAAFNVGTVCSLVAGRHQHAFEMPCRTDRVTDTSERRPFPFGEFVNAIQHRIDRIGCGVREAPGGGERLHVDHRSKQKPLLVD